MSLATARPITQFQFGVAFNPLADYPWKLACCSSKIIDFVCCQYPTFVNVLSWRRVSSPHFITFDLQNNFVFLHSDRINPVLSVIRMSSRFKIYCLFLILPKYWSIY
jgi:hypothetical protein